MTANKAAAEIRHKILRKMSELELKYDSDGGVMWEPLREYVKGMAPRASKKRGGLGRK